MRNACSGACTSQAKFSQNYCETAQWFRKAADQGNAKGQYSLGALYVEGRGVPQDYGISDMSLNLAAAGGDKHAAETRDALIFLFPVVSTIRPPDPTPSLLWDKVCRVPDDWTDGDRRREGVNRMQAFAVRGL
jgi:TPR repeat protein